jgi:hypothetical protein
MHVDESQLSFSSDELSLQPGSDWRSAVVDAPPAELAKSDKHVPLGRQRHPDQPEPRRNDMANGPSLVVNGGNDEEVSQGIVAIRAMTFAAAVPRPGKVSGRARKTVRACVSRYLPLCVFLLAACEPTTTRSPADAITFDTSKGLGNFEFATAGGGKPGEWSIVENDAGRVFAQIDTDPTDDRSPLAIYRPYSGRNVHVSIRFMTISGEIDRAAGVFVRFASVDDFYAARASALENSVCLYRVVDGRREMIGSMEVNVSGQTWHTLGIVARDERLTIFFDGRELFVAVDRRFPGPPGKVGLWTKADSMTWFESLKIGSLD